MQTYSPGEIADRTGFSLDTLRYYERIGLLDDIARTPGGQRIFNDGDVAWLEILRCLRDTGMPIAQMRRYADLTRDECTMRERVDLLEEHDREIGRRLEELAAQREHIRGKIRYYRSLDVPAEGE
ncbi:MerR family transcriptional regulator [Actinoplanes friuliensis]|jgi:DNA-binding transcriptional MerR regulator|uniref:Regulatory protein MerR n=1 Tax=Actinoplanes friuliensis DSM 7358 TaxID=1246995 RepID=U5W792_9ACTN|nr:MerR family transcriptional regulator [Actinoplanes friuliensis]AGZ44877.1 regulatory protein MerR [Actinoplanes friuliensis DSM 7358]